MLVLSRKVNEKIVIGEEITVTVVSIRGDKVRLGVEAAADIPIHRAEIHEAIEQERKEEREKGKRDQRENPSD